MVGAWASVWSTHGAHWSADLAHIHLHLWLLHDWLLHLWLSHLILLVLVMSLLTVVSIVLEVLLSLVSISAIEGLLGWPLLHWWHLHLHFIHGWHWWELWEILKLWHFNEIPVLEGDSVLWESIDGLDWLTEVHGVVLGGWSSITASLVDVSEGSLLEPVIEVEASDNGDEAISPGNFLDLLAVSDHFL